MVGQTFLDIFSFKAMCLGIITNFTLCALQDIACLQKLKKNSSDGSQSFSGARVFNFNEFPGVDVSDVGKWKSI